ncbi:hypothetical protein ZIOFF_029054 [Zingiber officinale]|uniref:Uncharacterized protein n=1 Tax=Zingiber officinale TaxID=94328 RepID=A0A8J5H7L3_ZINOF|nr:hypothetical protein ZIOFF_029054 [Zingiber officinale]
MESAGDGCAPEVQLPEQRPTTSPCRKKKEPDAGFLDDVKDHLDQFVSTSMDQHRICLKKTIRGMSDYVKLRKQRKRTPPVYPAMASSFLQDVRGRVDEFIHAFNGGQDLPREVHHSKSDFSAKSARGSVNGSTNRSKLTESAILFLKNFISIA